MRSMLEKRPACEPLPTVRQPATALGKREAREAVPDRIRGAPVPRLGALLNVLLSVRCVESVRRHVLAEQAHARQHSNDCNHAQ